MGGGVPERIGALKIFSHILVQTLATWVASHWLAQTFFEEFQQKRYLVKMFRIESSAWSWRSQVLIRWPRRRIFSKFRRMNFALYTHKHVSSWKKRKIVSKTKSTNQRVSILILDALVKLFLFNGSQFISPRLVLSTFRSFYSSLSYQDLSRLIQAFSMKNVLELRALNMGS